LPQTEVVFYAESDGTCPLLAWLDRLPQKVQDKCIVRIERLAELGHELRRPEADTLRDGIHELRASYQGVQYRILYFFHAGVAVLAHGIVKERQVPDAEIERTKRRRAVYEASPELHTYREPEP
jgi:phage-related protein